MDKRSKARLQLILLAVFFLGPLLVSFFIYYATDWRPSGMTIHGELLDPPPLLPDTALNENQEILRQKWSLILIDNGECDAICQKTLYETRQIRRALGKETGRLQRIFILAAGTADNEFLSDQHPGLIIVKSAAPISGELLTIIGDYEIGDIFLADPIGNLIMRFPRNTSMSDVHNDLKRLLKASRIG